ncbi:MAG: NAD(P)-dependent oxidoreductase [Lachnospiraceae bacterium]|nr:NAD(P)-dependent oxidoreductase [Lachnospiraceae bacterium]
MKVLVTGANGYLGCGIIEQLIKKTEVDVVACDISTQNLNGKLKTIQCDLFSLEDPYTYFGKPDVVLHLAWRDGFVHYSDSHVEDLYKHYLFLGKMAKSGVRKIAVLGSMHEVGFYEGCINEDTSCNPITQYGISKNALRQLTEIICKQNGVLFQWLRGYYIVGSCKNGRSIFSKIALAASEGERCFPFTMGQNQYDFIDYDEFTMDVVKAIMQDEVLGVIEICSGQPEKLSTRVEKFIKENGYDIELKYGAFPDRPYDSKAVWGSNDKIKKIVEG